MHRFNEVAPPGLRLPFEDEAFDLVTTLDVIEHVDDDVATLAELRRVLRPGGLLLVAVPAYMFLWGTQDEVSQHRRRYTNRTLRRALCGSRRSLPSSSCASYTRR